MKESEARAKYCPIKLVGVLPGLTGTTSAPIAEALGEISFCDGSKCMMWIERTKAIIIDGRCQWEADGDCGLKRG